jgi:hypothetical protein
MHKTKKLTLLALMLMIALVVAACGGDDDDDDSEASIPDAAAAEQVALDYLTAEFSADVEQAIELSCVAERGEIDADAAPEIPDDFELNTDDTELTVEIDGEEAVASLTGTIVITAEGQSFEQNAEDLGQLRLVVEDGEWKVCGEPDAGGVGEETPEPDDPLETEES